MLKFVSEDRKVKVNKTLLKIQLKDLLISEGFILGDVVIVFCSDELLLKYNKQYLNHDFFTDIITFDYREDKIISGDLMLSIDRIKENAITNNVSFLNEFHRVCFHGLLHLCGYKDKTQNEKDVMREKETFYLSKYNIPV